MYQCNRPLAADEVEWLSNSLTTFLDSWKAHGQTLTSSFLIRENIFLIVAVDEASYGASGCSIDASVHELQLLQQKLGVDFFTRDTVVFKKASGLERVKLTDLKGKIAEGDVQAEDLLFNTLVVKKAELGHNWLAPAGGSWLKRYFKTADTFQ